MAIDIDQPAKGYTIAGYLISIRRENVCIRYSQRISLTGTAVRRSPVMIVVGQDVHSNIFAGALREPIGELSISP